MVKDKVCHFQEAWMHDERFKQWVRKHPTDNKKAICLYCHKREISLGNMGVSALTSHMKSNNHKTVEGTNVWTRLFFKPRDKEEPTSTA